jgi:lipid-binding SYLF domain-containing protein
MQPRTLSKVIGPRLVYPCHYSVGGMSAGFQVGGSSTDFVLLLMTPKVVNQILNGKTKMGTDATAAAGPGAPQRPVHLTPRF